MNTPKHRVESLQRLNTMGLMGAAMATPVFDATTREHEPKTRPKMMVVFISTIGPALACSQCGVLSDIHSTDLDALNGWANEHALGQH